MAQVTPQMVKELRDRTGVSMGKCKEALEGANGDMELALANLRKAGIAGAVKKEGRETKEGMIAVAENERAIALVEINAETDFVVKNEKFQAFAKHLAEEALKQGAQDVEMLLKQKNRDHGTLEEYRASVIQSLGENIKVRRLLFLTKKGDASYAVYSHAGGRLVTLVTIVGGQEEQALAKDIAMHIAADAPEYLKKEDVPSSVIAHEREIARAQVQNKPPQIVERIVDAKLESYFKQFCLLDQQFVKMADLTIQQLLEKRGKETGQSLQVTHFVRWKVGN
jgi:elongation factor Ts